MSFATALIVGLALFMEEGFSVELPKVLQDAIGVLKKPATSSQQAERYHDILKNLHHVNVHRRQEQILRRNRQLSDRPVSKIMYRLRIETMSIGWRKNYKYMSRRFNPTPPGGYAKLKSLGDGDGEGIRWLGLISWWMVPHLTTGRHWSRFLRLATSIKSKFDCKFNWVSILTEAFFGIEYSQSRICTVRWRDSRNDMCYPQRIPGPISLLSDYWQDLPHDSSIFFARKFYGLGNCT